MLGCASGDPCSCGHPCAPGGCAPVRARSRRARRGAAFDHAAPRLAGIRLSRAAPARAQVRFERGTVATPELLQDVDLPSSVSVLGQPVDLTPVKARPGAPCLAGLPRPAARLLPPPAGAFRVAARRVQARSGGARVARALNLI
jgi:hypothetical protein